MSKADLESLNLRELRQLASEHHVNNRSRLAKQELIQALSKLVKVKADGAKKAAPKPAKAKKEEPEVLDAQAVASLTKDSTDSKPAAKAEAAEESKERDEGTKGRRRRNRGRSRNRKDAKDEAKAEKAPPVAESAAKSESEAATALARVAKPKLDNKRVRSVPPILKRLKLLAGGLLELCDPETPSWAQARLSELLAEAGVHPTPCQGPAHPDFHEVLGTVKTDQVPDGHIALIEAPGFSLRGDRGDLFALRKAKVRLAGKEAKDVAVASESAPAPAKPTERKAATARETTPAADKESESSVASSGPVLDETAPRPAPKAVRAPKTSQAAALPLEPQSHEELEARGFSENFGKLGLHEQIQADLHDMGFEKPSPIQEQCIPIALTGSDIIGQAQTGTGKTAAFVLPILHNLYHWTEQGPVALICCPTRELARQVHAEFIKMAGQSAARAALIYGGVSMDDQFKALAAKPHVVIATPGRLIDHIKRHTLDLSRLKILVLDEADQMLDIGFLPDIEYIFKHSNPERQCLLFSATMSDEILRITQQYQKDPAHVHVKPEIATADNVDQKFIAVDRDKKNGLLAHFIETHNPEQLVVFCRTKAQTDRVAQVLRKKKKKAAAIHGDLPQGKRERTLQQFRDGSLHCLIATNVAARGLDIPAISHVVNYDIPENPDEYVHRIGRTGRMGAKGVARTFITSEDGQFLVEIEKHIGFELEEEVIEGFTASTKTEVKRSIADTPTNTPKLLKPLVGGIRLGRRRR